MKNKQDLIENIIEHELSDYQGYYYSMGDLIEMNYDDLLGLLRYLNQSLNDGSYLESTMIDLDFEL